jgi:hypothetical protein
MKPGRVAATTPDSPRCVHTTDSNQPFNLAGDTRDAPTGIVTEPTGVVRTAH